MQVDVLPQILSLLQNNGYQCHHQDNKIIIYNQGIPFVIPIIPTNEYWRFPTFIYKGKRFNVNELIALAIEEKVSLFNNYSSKYFENLLIDIRNILEFGISKKDLHYHKPVRYNSTLKLSNKIKFLKHWRVSKGEITYFNSLSETLSSKEQFSKDELTHLLSKVKLDLCKVDNTGKNIIVSLPKEHDFKASCYGSDTDNFFTFFKNSPSIPTRLTQAITSDGYMPVYKKCHHNYILNSLDKHILCNDKKSNGINAVVVFIPDVQDNDLFLCGEILCSKNFAANVVEFERTLSIPIPIDYLDLPKIGSHINQWSKVGEIKKGMLDGEKKRKFLFNLPYKGGKLTNIKCDGRITTLTFNIESQIGSSRIISDHGIKGCILPIGIGYVNTNMGKIIPDLIVGPNAMKGGFSGIRLSSLALECHINERPIDLTLDKTNIYDIESLVNSKQVIRGEWVGPFGKMECFIGVEHVVITDLSNDYQFGKVKIAPETIRFLSLSGNQELVNELMKEYLPKNQALLLNEVVDILMNTGKSSITLVYNQQLKDILKNTAIDIRTMTIGSELNSILSNESNTGICVKIGNKTIKLPSYKLIKSFIFEDGLLKFYPDFCVYANKILLSLRNGAEPEQLENNLTNYYNSLVRLLLSKKGLIVQASSIFVEGGNFKQIPFHLVPKNVIVLPHPWYEEKYSPLHDHEQYDLYDIGCRNPVLWMSMLRSRRIWTFTEFKDYLESIGYNIFNLLGIKYLKGVVLRNPQDCMLDQSDADGDLFPLAVPLKGQCQKLCRPLSPIVPNNSSLLELLFLGDWKDEINGTGTVKQKKGFFRQPVLSMYQHKWTKDYYDGEYKSLEETPFKIHVISRKQFNEYYISGSIAKGDIGIATTSLWKFNTAIEILLQRGFDSERCFEVMSIYAALLQDYVIRGVKHSLNTSSNFEMFLVENINKKPMEITKILLDMGLEKQTIDLFFIVANIAKTDNVTSYALMPNGTSSSWSNLFDGIKSIKFNKLLVKEELISIKALQNILAQSKQ